MTALLIDTLSFATQLRSTGFTSQQSDGLARALYDAVLDRVATKRDTEGLKQDLTELKKDVGIIKQDVAIGKQEVEIIKQDVRILKQDVEILKQDVKEIKLDIVDIKRSIASLDGRLTETKIEMIKWSVGSVVGMSALVVGGLKLIL